MWKKMLMVFGGAVVLLAAGFGVLVASATNVRLLREPSSLAANGSAERTRTKEALDYSVAATIQAPPEVVWGVLTNGPAYPSWNTTVLKLDGAIAKDANLKLVSIEAPNKAFDLKVSAFDAPKQMVWEDGGKSFIGVRTFTLLPAANGATTFAMSETFSGAMLGMIEGSLPDFRGSFSTFTADLKKAAESKAAGVAR